MTHIFTDIALLGVFAFFAVRLIGGRRTITPTTVPPERPEQRSETPDRCEPRVGLPGYLLEALSDQRGSGRGAMIFGWDEPQIESEAVQPVSVFQLAA